ncbi:MAG: nucleoside hydrolase [Pirellulales bacterium]
MAGRKPSPVVFPAVAIFGLLIAAAARGADKIPVLLDTDIGSAIDDAFALALVLASPELELRGITTVGRQAEDRAWMVCRFLTHLNLSDIPVACGRGRQPDFGIDWQIQYRRHPAVVWNRTNKPAKLSAVELMYQKLKADPGKVTIVAVGPLTNIARLLERHPDAKPWINSIALMGGSIGVGYDGKRPAVAEWNIKNDIKAAQTVFASGLPLVMVPLDVTAGLLLDERRRLKLFAAHTPMTSQVQALFQLSDDPGGALFDPAAIAAVARKELYELEPAHIVVDDRGFTRAGNGIANVTVAKSLCRKTCLDWVVATISDYGEQRLPEPPKNIVSFVDRGGLPNRVHVFEDYDTDIEKRWWMTGRLETKDVPLGGLRACRSVLTQDFDAKMGDTESTYAAVVFNPVPGPPMGKNTRLSFRYKLLGADRLRVQLFSLSNGYHRYLSLKDVPNNEWITAAVDMTQMRRPDGSGGPLAENERIDDIQFYIDPRAELLIDNAVLYDAAPHDESRPFPKRFVFSGWFDTGKQGLEWPGDFEIVLHKKPRTWDAAKSVAHKKTGKPWLRVYFRGRRPVGELTRTRFDYQMTTAGKLRIVLADSQSGWSAVNTVECPNAGKWVEQFLDFDTSKLDAENRFVDEIQFYPPIDAELLLDNLLVYEPRTQNE